MIKPEDYYPLLFFQTRSPDTATMKLQNVINDFISLGRMFMGSGAQVVFSIFQLENGTWVEGGEQTSWMNGYIDSDNQGFRYYDLWTYLWDTRNVDTDWDTTDQRGKNILGSKLVEPISRALNQIWWGKEMDCWMTEKGQGTLSL